MNKKNYRLLLIVSAVVTFLALSSCNKYLDYKSPSVLSLQETFEDVTYTNSQVVGIYTELTGASGYGRQLSIYFPLGSDDFTYKSSSSFDPTASYAIANFGAGKESTVLYNVMVQLYNGIERANIACKYIPASKLYNNGTDAQKKALAIYYGEALTLRAQFYYELIRNWGDVPASFIPAADRASNFSGNVDRDSTYDRILSDLKQAEDLMPWRDAIPTYGDFRITKGTVKGLRARIALARGGYSLRNDSRIMERKSDYLKYYRIAFNECLDIIKSNKHGLNPVYENIFKSLHTSSRYDDTYELMFEVAMYGQVNDSNIGSLNGLNFVNTPSWGTDGGDLTAVPTYFYEFDTLGNDSRREVTLSYFKVQTDATKTLNQKLLTSAASMNIGKFRKSWTGFNASITSTYGINWPILRYSDVLLMYAEAANELQDFTGSVSPLAALQKVQQRAYGSNPIPSTPTDHDGFFNAIVKERLLEFGGEGIRKYDLIRWNLLATKIAETKKKIAQFAIGSPTDGNPYSNCPDYVYAAATAFNNGTCKIESDSLKLNGGIPNSVFFKKSTLSSAPAAYPSRIPWRKDAGTYTGGVLASPYLTDANSGYVSRYIQNAKELLPYPNNFINENRGGVIQNFAYQQ